MKAQHTSMVALAYDCTNAQSFTSITKWFAVAHEFFQSRKIKGVLVANKIDNSEAIAVTRQQGESQAQEMGLEFFEVSAVYFLILFF